MLKRAQIPSRKVLSRFSKVLISSLFLASTLTACPNNMEEDPDTTDSPSSEATSNPTKPTNEEFIPSIGKKGGTRLISSTTLPKTFNVYLAAETSSTDVLGQMYLGLVQTDAATTKIMPSMAESWEISEDKMTYTFKLRDGLKWSDGQPLTAHDVEFTYNEVIDNDKIPNNYRDGLLLEGKFPKIEVVDDKTIKFITHKPFAPFLRGLSDPIVPKHIFDGTTKPDSNGKVAYNQMWGINVDVSKVVCNGPWKLSENVPGQRVVLEPNPNYYLKDKNGTQLPYLDKFITIEVQDLSTSIIKFQAKETDALSLRAEDYDSLAPRQKQDNFKIHNLGPATGTLFVMFNMSTAKTKEGKPVVDPVKSAWFRDINFRQAMAHAIDKKGMIDSIYKGRAIPQTSHISQQNPFYNPNIAEFEYDLEKAQKILSDGGYKKDANGELKDSKGNRVEFDLVTNAGNTQRDAACAILKKDWGKLGVKVNYRPINFNVMVQSIDQTLDWQAMMIGLTGSAIEPHFGINTWKLDGRMHMFNMGHPKKWEGEGTKFEQWEKDMLDIYEKAAVEFDPEKRKELYWKSQEIAAKQLPFLYTANQLSMVAVRNKIGNVKATIHGGSALNQVNWNTDYHFIKE